MELNAMKEREAICDVCHKMWQRGIVAANDGNVSVKLEDGTFLCTPSGVSKAAMTPEILVHLAGIADTALIAAAGYAPMLYGNQRDLLRLAPELRAAYPVWLAEYDVEAPTAPLDFAIWQYTNAGTVPGIPTDVDLNVWLEPQK